MLNVRAVKHGNLIINSWSIKFSKSPPLPESTPESTLLDMRGDRLRNVSAPAHKNAGTEPTV